MDDLLNLDLMRVRILHHAASGNLYGLGIMEELASTGHRLAPGTLYPMLHGLERRGLLISQRERVDRRYRRVYRITSEGRVALENARKQLGELFVELFKKEVPGAAESG
jgi:PadR family transcriptional regulator, regulatory protein PadR